MTIKVSKHSWTHEFPDAYMIADDFGVWCGHNTFVYIEFECLRDIDCPTIFRSKRKAVEEVEAMLKWCEEMDMPASFYHWNVPPSERFDHLITESNILAFPGVADGR